ERTDTDLGQEGRAAPIGSQVLERRPAHRSRQYDFPNLCLVETLERLANRTEADPGMRRTCHRGGIGMTFEGKYEEIPSGGATRLDHADRQLAASGQYTDFSHCRPSAGRSPARNRCG